MMNPIVFLTIVVVIFSTIELSFAGNPSTEGTERECLTKSVREIDASKLELRSLGPVTTSCDSPAAGSVEVVDSIEDIQDILVRIHDRVGESKGEAAGNITVSFDIDGVLSNFSDPGNLPRFGLFKNKSVARAHVKSVLEALSREGIKVVATTTDSSSTEPFKKLKAMGLSQYFDAQNCTQVRWKKIGLSEEGSCGNVEVTRKGKSTSDIRRKQIEIFRNTGSTQTVINSFQINAVGGIRRDLDGQGPRRSFLSRVFTRSKYPLYEPFLRDRGSRIGQQKLHALLASTGEIENRSYIEYLRQEYPNLGFLFDAQNSRRTRFYEKNSKNTIEEHTLEVMDQFDQQVQSLPLIREHENDPTGTVRLKDLMKLTLALHDIGKPIEGRQNQHRNTKEVLIHTMKEMGLTDHEIDIAESIVLDKPVVDLAVIHAVQKGRVNSKEVEEAAKAIISDAKRLGMDPELLLDLKRSFFVADGSFYSKFSKTFQKSDGRYRLSIGPAQNAWREIKTYLQSLNAPSTKKP